MHIELAPPTDSPPEGRLHDGSLIPLSSGGRSYPSTEQTLAAVSMLLNGGGMGQIQDITEAFSTAFAGREKDLRSLIEQLDRFVAYLNDQKDDIIAATESLNNSGRPVRRRRNPCWTRRCRPFRTRCRCSRTSATTWPRPLDSVRASSAPWRRLGEPDARTALVAELEATGPGAGIAGQRRARR